MLAGQLVDLLAFLDIIVAYGAQLVLVLCCCCLFRQLVVLLLVDTFGDFSHFLLELQKLLVGHVVGVYVDASLVLHAHHHASEILHIN